MANVRLRDYDREVARCPASLRDRAASSDTGGCVQFVSSRIDEQVV
jgi:hypothetical protein